MIQRTQRTVVNHDIWGGAELGLSLGKGRNDFLLFRYVCFDREGFALRRVAAGTRGDDDFVAFRGKFGRDGLEEEVDVLRGV